MAVFKDKVQKRRHFCTGFREMQSKRPVGTNFFKVHPDLLVVQSSA
jgi:hypothetical protein